MCRGLCALSCGRVVKATSLSAAALVPKPQAVCAHDVCVQSMSIGIAANSRSSKYDAVRFNSRRRLASHGVFALERFLVFFLHLSYKVVSDAYLA